MNIELNRRAAAILEQVKDRFDEHCLPGILEHRVGDLSEADVKEIASGKRIDTRPPAIIMRSGKGGPGYEEWINVTLLDHVTAVAMGATMLALVDMLSAGLDPAQAARRAAVTFAGGFLHDVDKLAEVGWDQVTAETVERYYTAYGVDRFLRCFDVELTAEQMAVLVAYDEARSSHLVRDARVPDSYVVLIRTYVRLADKLDSVWLSDLPALSGRKVIEAWQLTCFDGTFAHPEAFQGFRPLVVSDPHHSFLLDKLSSEIAAECEDTTGLRPFFHTVRDDTLVSLLPLLAADSIIEAAIGRVCADLPFDFGVDIIPAGIPRAVGSCPDWDLLKEHVKEALPLGKLTRLLAVKRADMQQHEAKILALAAAAGCPANKVGPSGTGKTDNLVRTQLDPEAPEFPQVLMAAILSLALGIDQTTSDKAYTREAREKAVLCMLDPEALAWAGDMDALTRRTVLSLAATARMRDDADLRQDILDMVSKWFGPEGMFQDMVDTAGPVRTAVRDRLLDLCAGQAVVVTHKSAKPDGQKYCLITAEPVDGEPISGTDGLYSLSPSAVSYRAGRPESRFSEKSGTWISPVTYAEYRLRAQAYAAMRGGEGDMPIRLCSPQPGGIFSSLALSKLDDVGEYGVFELVRKDCTKRVYSSLESFRSQTRLGRFEVMPRTLATKGKSPGRIAILKVAMMAALRYGRPIHIFSGLPHPRKDYFHCDCMDAEIRLLLGGDSFRLEQLPEAIRRLETMASIAEDMRMLDVAKAFCIPATRFGAACIAWGAARDNDQIRADIVSRLSDFLHKEHDLMEHEGTTSRVVTLGKLAAAVQALPRYNASTNDQVFMFKMALESATSCWASGMRDDQSLASAIASRIDEYGTRRHPGRVFFAAKDNRLAGQSMDEALEAFAACFVEFWRHECRGRPPSSAQRQLFTAIYRWSFLQAPRAAKQGPSDDPAAISADASA